MRSVKRPRRPVRRYKSLLFPGAAVLAVFLFWAAFAPSERGETRAFAMDGLRLNITGVHHEGGSMARFDPVRNTHEAIDTYHVYPGAKVIVLEAPPMEDGAARWELREAWEDGVPDQEPLGLTDGVDPAGLSERGDYKIYDLERNLTALYIIVREPDEDYWK